MLSKEVLENCKKNLSVCFYSQDRDAAEVNVERIVDKYNENGLKDETFEKGVRFFNHIKYVSFIKTYSYSKANLETVLDTIPFYDNMDKVVEYIETFVSKGAEESNKLLVRNLTYNFLQDKTTEEDFILFNNLLDRGVHLEDFTKGIPGKNILEMKNEELANKLLSESVIMDILVTLLSNISVEDIKFIITNKDDILEGIDYKNTSFKDQDIKTLLDAFDKLPNSLKETVFKIISKISSLDTGSDEEINAFINAMRGIKSELTYKKPKSESKEEPHKNETPKTEKVKNNKPESKDVIIDCIKGNENFPFATTGNFDERGSEYINLISKETFYKTKEEFEKFKQDYLNHPVIKFLNTVNNKLGSLNPYSYMIMKGYNMDINIGQSNIIDGGYLFCFTNSNANAMFCLYTDMISVIINNGNCTSYNLLFDKVDVEDLYAFTEQYITGNINPKLFAKLIKNKALVSVPVNK